MKYAINSLIRKVVFRLSRLLSVKNAVRVPRVRLLSWGKYAPETMLVSFQPYWIFFLVALSRPWLHFAHSHISLLLYQRCYIS